MPWEKTYSRIIFPGGGKLILEQLLLEGYLTHMQCNVSLCNGDSVRPAVRPAGRRGKNFNVGYISLNIRGRLLIFGIHIDHMDLYPPDL